MSEPSNPKPTSGSERKYEKLSAEDKQVVLDDLKEHLRLLERMEQAGYPKLSPEQKAAFHQDWNREVDEAKLQKREPLSLSQYAQTYASGLEQRAGFLASSLVAFSGKQPASKTAADSKVVFETHFEMRSAGFEPVRDDIVSLVAPSVSEMANESLFNSAYQVAVAFLCTYSADAAHKSMRPENAEEFSSLLSG